jgi:Integrase core domain
MKTAFAMLWDAFAEHGLPSALLCDNAFGTTFEVPKTISWFEARLIRLGIQPIHGRPYHPQTQGKVERLHGTLQRELWPHIRRDSLGNFSQDLEHWRSDVYNTCRPHEALADQPPASQWAPSSRTRPSSLPEVTYPTGALLRKVSTSGDVRWRGYRILAGRGIVGQLVRIEESDSNIDLYYHWKRIRSINTQLLKTDIML